LNYFGAGTRRGARTSSAPAARRRLYLDEPASAVRRSELELQLPSEGRRDPLKRVPPRRADVEALFEPRNRGLRRSDPLRELRLREPGARTHAPHSNGDLVNEAPLLEVVSHPPVRELRGEEPVSVDGASHGLVLAHLWLILR